MVTMVSHCEGGNLVARTMKVFFYINATICASASAINIISCIINIFAEFLFLSCISFSRMENNSRKGYKIANSVYWCENIFSL